MERLNLKMLLVLAAFCEPALGDPNIAQNKPVTASSIEFPTVAESFAVDGDSGTRWASAYSDPQWIRIDLGSPKQINRVVLNWEAAYGQSYQIQVSDDDLNWTDIFSTSTGNGGIEDLTGLSGTGRYLRMLGTVRGTIYGYSLWEIEVYELPPPIPPGLAILDRLRSDPYPTEAVQPTEFLLTMDGMAEVVVAVATDANGLKMLSYDITGLALGRHTVSVKARNEGGESVPSMLTFDVNMCAVAAP